jgi:hypothetical protein
VLRRVMTIDGQRFKVDRCDDCKLRGLLRRKPVRFPYSALDTTIPIDSLETFHVNLCITCFETPAGIESENTKKK